MITVYLGDVGEYLANLARAADPTATLITHNNVYNLTDGTYYTSLGDLGNLTNFGGMFRTVDKIIYAPPPGTWSDYTHFSTFPEGSKMKFWTEDYLNIFSWKIIIENFPKIPVPENKQVMLALADKRKSNCPQLWSVGCSISHGIGVQPTQRYGQLLADELRLPVSFLTSPGSSIIWAADQILRSDIQAGDIVIWGLTSIPRLTYFNDSLIHVNNRLYSKIPKFNDVLDINVLDSKDTFYRSLIGVKQVINFCKKLKVKLIIVSLLDDTIVKYISDFPNIIILHNLWGRDKTDLFEDLGDDNQHPGVKTHAFYASQILKRIKE